MEELLTLRDFLLLFSVEMNPRPPPVNYLLRQVSQKSFCSNFFGLLSFSVRCEEKKTPSLVISLEPRKLDCWVVKACNQLKVRVFNYYTSSI